MRPGPLENDVIDTIALLSDTRKAGENELADAMECDLASARRRLEQHCSKVAA